MKANRALLIVFQMESHEWQICRIEASENPKSKHNRQASEYRREEGERAGYKEEGACCRKQSEFSLAALAFGFRSVLIYNSAGTGPRSYQPDWRLETIYSSIIPYKEPLVSII